MNSDRDSEYSAFRFPRWILAFVALAALLTWSGGALAQKIPPVVPLDLNTATSIQLQQIPGVGPATANAIVHFREKSGPFRKVDDLLAIKTISPAKLDKIRPYVTVTAAPHH